MGNFEVVYTANFMCPVDLKRPKTPATFKDALCTRVNDSTKCKCGDLGLSLKDLFKDVHANSKKRPSTQTCTSPKNSSKVRFPKVLRPADTVQTTVS